MKVVLTGATGTIGQALIHALRDRGDDVAVLSRNPARSSQTLGGEIDAHTWAEPESEAPPTSAFAGADAIVHLAGEPVDQRWNEEAKERIRASRELGTRNLVAGIKAAGTQMKTLVSASASGYYGARGDERVPDRTRRPGDDDLHEVPPASEWSA